ncbi:MAG TPA: hypothetical protein VF630_02760 [Hymenobacter sp.]|jgi:hypothetical protein
MRHLFLSLLAGALLLSGTAQAQAPAAEVLSLTTRLNQLVRIPEPDDNAEVLVSLANCGVRQTIRKYRTPAGTSSTNINVSSTKKGGSWGVKTDEKVELELTFALDWAEVGSIDYSPQQDSDTGRRYYDLTVKRRERAEGKKSSGLADSITFALHTQNEQEVAELVRRLNALSRKCQGAKI